MRRLLAMVLLLGGVSSCVSNRSDFPYPKTGNQRISTRPTPPSPTTWKSPTGVPAGAVVVPQDARPDPNAGLYDRASLDRDNPTPYGSHPLQPGSVLPPASLPTDLGRPLISAYADDKGSGMGPPPGLPSTPEPVGPPSRQEAPAKALSSAPTAGAAEGSSLTSLLAAPPFSQRIEDLCPG